MDIRKAKTHSKHIFCDKINSNFLFEKRDNLNTSSFDSCSICGKKLLNLSHYEQRAWIVCPSLPIIKWENISVYKIKNKEKQ